jgi:magnesium chelatase subunit H
LDVRVFSDRALPGSEANRFLTNELEAVEDALQDADVFFGSLIFDGDRVLWLRELPCLHLHSHIFYCC